MVEVDKMMFDWVTRQTSYAKRQVAWPRTATLPLNRVQTQLHDSDYLVKYVNIVIVIALLVFAKTLSAGSWSTE